ncbi:hypothetical protein ABMA28_007936 [Loxostege sticticalis]|uniref:FP protein C-terminal domain-containing protein n=1 Tax=Loxostege sticticalis TaxID=481309 RepID=A0ABD0SJC7_LOXSC
MSTQKSESRCCGGCRQALEHTSYLTCSSCSLHYDLHCAGVTVQRFGTLTGDHRAAWKCVTCRSREPKTGNIETPVRAGEGGVTVRRGASKPPAIDIDMDLDESLGDPANLTHDGPRHNSAEVLAGVQALVAEWRLFREEVRADLRLIREEVREDLRALRGELRELAGLVRRCEGRVDVVEERLETLEREASGNNAAVGARIDAVEARMEAAEQHRAEAGPDGAEGLRRTVDELKLELNERDQEALLSDLEIGQLPEQKGENVVHAVIVLATRLGVPLEERDVVFAERVGAPPAEAGGRARRVVVRLARRHLRDELLRAARVRRGMAAEGGGRVFINERLTRSNRQLFHRVREECRRLQWRYSWTRRGRIFTRKSDGAQVFQLRSPGDLERVFGPAAI